jgi:hypothetical protein
MQLDVRKVGDAANSASSRRCAPARVRGRFTLMEAKLRKPKELLSRTNVTVEIEGKENQLWSRTGSD